MTSEEVEPTQNKTKILEPPSSFSSLPDEITENILARISRWEYPSLSLVSKSFRSLLSSMEIYKTRSQIGATETCVFVCFKLPDPPRERWFSLWTKPNKNLTKKRGKIRFKRDSSGNSVVPTPFSPSHSPPLPYDNETLDSNIYIIGGAYEEPSSSVRIFDSRSHTWRDAPNMTVARKDAHPVLLDGKIYVMGGCDIDKYSTNWIEVFDIKTQSWTALPGPGADEDELRDCFRENLFYFNIVNAFQGKIYLATHERDYTYEPKDGAWKLVREKSSFIRSIATWREVGNVICGCTDSGYLMWSDSEIDGSSEWREIKGLEKLREHPLIGLKSGIEFELVDYGGNLLVMWNPYPIISRSGIRRRNRIWYAKISLESRCNGREVWGKVECVDFLTFPVEPYEWFCCLTASV